MKKFYIRKTQQEALAEQNVLLKQLLSQHETATIHAASHPVNEFQTTPSQIQHSEPISNDFDFEDAMYIPKISKSNSQLNIASTKVDLDMANVDKLKKNKSKSNKERTR